ncbi:hypothetical protein Cni_G26554 [Canna indica]|uniref:Uncharacterized protein n=1 Tax=Canna indica TaxID=4628 RepID=A0AAQ3QQL8_9LILI|nr:hypothetical protein Cni_G26554 [Canna indica]
MINCITFSALSISLATALFSAAFPLAATVFSSSGFWVLAPPAGRRSAVFCCTDVRKAASRRKPLASHMLAVSHVCLLAGVCFNAQLAINSCRIQEASHVFVVVRVESKPDSTRSKSSPTTKPPLVLSAACKTKHAVSRNPLHLQFRFVTLLISPRFSGNNRLPSQNQQHLIPSIAGSIWTAGLLLTISSNTSRTSQSTLISAPPLLLVQITKMASGGKASLVVAASVAAVEALKDQAGLCRWNYALRSLHQRAKHSVAAPLSQAKRSAASSSLERWRRGGEGAAERAKRTEESLSRVLYWDACGPK